MWIFPSLLLFITLGILRTSLCCKKFVPDVDEPPGDYPLWLNTSFAGKLDPRLYIDRPITNFSRFHRHVETGCMCGLHNKKPLPDEPSNRVFGGTSAAKNEYPWQVALAVTNSRVSFCGGSLINDHFVLTAAHCVIGKPAGLLHYAGLQFLDFVVLLHAHALNANLNEIIDALERGIRSTPEEIEVRDAADGVIRIKVKQVIVHPGYVRSRQIFQGRDIDNDVALLRLENPVRLTRPDGPWTICLPETDHFDLYTSQTALVAGWGLTVYGNNHSLGRNLQHVNVSIMDMTFCQLIERSFPISFHFLCIGRNTPGGRAMDAGQGDSGGPLLMKVSRPDKDQYMQIGIAAFQNKFDARFIRTSQAYSAYSRVTEALSWIYAEIEKHVDIVNNIIYCQR